MNSAIENAGIEDLVSAQFTDAVENPGKIQIAGIQDERPGVSIQKSEVRKNSIPYKARLPTCNFMERLRQRLPVMFPAISTARVEEGYRFNRRNSTKEGAHGSRK
jgi:hypothetical protein